MSIVLSRSTKLHTVALLKATSFSVKDLSKTMKVNMKLKFSLLKLKLYVLQLSADEFRL